MAIINIRPELPDENVTRELLKQRLEGQGWQVEILGPNMPSTDIEKGQMVGGIKDARIRINYGVCKDGEEVHPQSLKGDPIFALRETSSKLRQWHLGRPIIGETTLFEHWKKLALQANQVVNYETGDSQLNLTYPRSPEKMYECLMLMPVTEEPGQKTVFAGKLDLSMPLFDRHSITPPRGALMNIIQGNAVSSGWTNEDNHIIVSDHLPISPFAERRAEKYLNNPLTIGWQESDTVAGAFAVEDIIGPGELTDENLRGNIITLLCMAQPPKDVVVTQEQSEAKHFQDSAMGLAQLGKPIPIAGGGTSPATTPKDCSQLAWINMYVIGYRPGTSVNELTRKISGLLDAGAN